MRIFKWIRSLFTRKKKSETPPIEEEVPQEVLWQTTFLSEDEMLVYIDSHRVVHYITRSPIVKDKDYKILLYTEDL